MKNGALLRIARRAVRGAESLPVEDRVQLFNDLALILPPQEAQAARDIAVYLTQSMKMQRDFLHILQ